MQRIKELQQTDPKLMKIRKTTLEVKKPDFQVSDYGIVKFRGRLCVPGNQELRKEILT